MVIFIFFAVSVERLFIIADIMVLAVWNSFDLAVCIMTVCIHCSGSSIIWTGIHFGQISTSKSFHWNHVYQSFFFLAKIIKFNPLLSSECEQYQQKMKTVVVSMNLLVYFISKLAMSASFNKLVLKSVSSLIQFCLSCLCLTWDGFCHWIISFALHQREKWKWSWNWHECRWIQR